MPAHALPVLESDGSGLGQAIDTLVQRPFEQELPSAEHAGHFSLRAWLCTFVVFAAQLALVTLLLCSRAPRKSFLGSPLITRPMQDMFKRAADAAARGDYSAAAAGRFDEY